MTAGTTARRAVLLFALAPVPGAAAAQEIPSSLTLEAALRLAAAHSPALARVREERSAAAAVERRGWGAFLPGVSLDAAVSGSSARTITGQDSIGRPISLAQPAEYTASSTQQGISFGYTLLDGGARVRELRAIRADADAGDARLRGEAARVRAEVKRRFYDAVRARTIVALEDTLLLLAREQLEATRAVLRVAARDPGDVLGAEADVAAQEQAVARAVADYRQACLALAESMGLPPAAGFDPAGGLPPAFDPGEVDAAELVAAALGASPRVAQAEAAAVAARHRAGAARAARWPTLSARAGISRGMSLSSMAAIRELNPQNRSMSFGFTASVPLFTQLRASARVAQAQAIASGAAEEVRAQRLAVEREVRSAVVDLDGAWRSLLLAERSAQLSRERVGLARDRYRLGSLGFTELQALLDRAARAERQVLDARHGFASSLATLEERLGRELPRP
jgi:outer membrane protein